MMLTDLGHIYFCTGARNHDLLQVFREETLTFEYDERMASFKALGEAKMTKKPIAICCTSGTAVAECVPAMLEATYSQIPLVLISGDRPKKMHGTGAPQTIEHEALTSSCRGSYFEIPFSDLSKINLSNAIFPVHINVLVDDTKAHSLPTVIEKDFSSFKTFLSVVERPLFLFSHEEESLRPMIQRFAEFKLPFYAESLSQGRDLSFFSSEKSIVQKFKAGEFDAVIRVGHTPLSKVWRLLEQNPLPVYSFDSRGLAALSHGNVLTLNGHELLSKNEWWDLVSRFSGQRPQESRSDLKQLLAIYPESEQAWMKRLHDSFSSSDTIYLGNSLVIRYFELIQDKNLPIFASRGVNGIDGQLATAIGMAQGTKSQVHCILGDITTLYDLSSLREMPNNLRLIIVNNHGGRIFETLNLDHRITMEHGYTFEKLVQGMGLTYAKNDLTSSAQIIELNPSIESTRSFREAWNA